MKSIQYFLTIQKPCNNIACERKELIYATQRLIHVASVKWGAAAGVCSFTSTGSNESIVSRSKTLTRSCMADEM